MVIATVILLTAVALFLIFRDDHDRSYPDDHYVKDTKKMDQKEMSPPGPTVRPTPPKPVVTPALNRVPTGFLDTLDYDDDLVEFSEIFSVTGMRYYCTDADLGLVFGTVRPEPANMHDPRAQVVKLPGGRTIGYIPRHQLNEYEDFNEENVVCPFIGEITKDEKGWFQAEILVIIPVSKDYVQEEFKGYLNTYRG